jgi:hypothetical protein
VSGGGVAVENSCVDASKDVKTDVEDVGVNEDVEEVGVNEVEDVGVNEVEDVVAMEAVAEEDVVDVDDVAAVDVTTNRMDNAGRVSEVSMTASRQALAGPDTPSGPIHCLLSDVKPNKLGPSPKKNPGLPFVVGHVILCDVPGHLSGLDPSVRVLQRGFVMEAEDPRYKIRLENCATFWTDTRQSWLKARWA